ncbi:MAG: hypothetical protein ThorAB25_24940 [Candidatus Thorarchaeota archaeon AB_25]|nr:MAG: hypothetical protein ThorAB25_24940 [Candidatus Thorarchaeota archaeon AB_25]
MSKVAVVRGERSLDTVYEALDLIPYKEALQRWDRVLIKVNFVTTKTWDTGTTTDPIVVEALINRVRELGKEVLVVETDAQVTNADKAVVKTGMKDMLDRVGVEFVNMRHSEEKIELPVTNGKALESIKVAKIATESAIISAAKLKGISDLGVTLGLKNMFGMLTSKWKFKFHRKGMHNVIHDVCSTLPPTLTVIDGFVGLKGFMPMGGTPVPFNAIIASTDSVASDSVGARIVGREPREIDYLRWLYESGLGEIENYEIVGDDIEPLKEIFANA